jgi:hypothetical protein
MTDQEFSTAKWWAEFWTKVEHWAFLGVVITLAVEFVALRLGEPYKKKLDDAKDLKIEQLRSENLKLQEKLAPRTISSEQKVALVKFVESMGPHDLDVIVVGDTYEISSFQQKLLEPFLSAKWRVRVWSAGPGLTVTGIVISVKNNPSPEVESLASQLLTVLNNSKIGAGVGPRFDTDLPTVLSGPTWDKNKIAPVRIYLGEKP